MSQPSPRPKAAKADRTWLLVGLGFVVFWGVYLVFFVPGRSGSSSRLANTGRPEPADYSWQVLDLDDKPVEFEQYKGKTIFLNVWATWCRPCVLELPSIAKLAANPKVKDVAFVCVSIDDSSARVKSFLKGRNWPMTVFRATRLPLVFTTEGIPATFIIAPDGKVVASEVGSSDWDDTEVVSFLEQVLKTKG
jgi:thiol-disulfide isomerase/thioredoxin